LFSSALLFYIRNQIAGGISDEFIPVAEEVPLEAQPVKVFVEDCVKKVATEGIIKLSAHGGYIDPTDAAYGSTFSVGIEPTESEALVILEDTRSMVPYWWYLKSPNDCISGCEFRSQRPALYKRETGERSIEGQIDTYIKQKLPACLEDFQSFREQGFRIDVVGDLEPDFKVAETEALVIVNYPLRATREGRQADISQFYTKVDVNLKQVYELATDIVNSELDNSFLEKHTMNLIAMYSKPVGVERLPPVGYFSFFSYGEYLIWTTTETKQRLESYVLPPGISLLQILGTSNYHRNVMFDLETGKYDRITTGIMDKTIVMLNSTKTYGNLDARLVYLDWWPSYVNINDAEILKPQEVESLVSGTFFSLLGMKQYTFNYDVSFPVLVTVTDAFAFSGSGLKFSFALESNLRRNAPMNSSFARLPRSAAISYFCDINQRNAGPIQVEVEDAFTGEPVPHARVDFLAGDEICFVGFAELDENNRSVLYSNFPVGIGELRVLKEDYMPTTGPFIAVLNASDNVTMKLIPFMFINATVVPIPLSYQGGGKYVLPAGPTTSSMNPKEKAIMTFKRIDDDGVGEYEGYLMYNVSEGPAQLMIVPGKYEVDGNLVLYEPRRVPKESKTFEMMFTDDVVVNFNETVFSQWNEGGAVFNNETGYLVITREQLTGSKMVQFRILRFPPPMTHSREVGSGPDMSQLSEYSLYSNIYRHELEPEWIR
jgi:hypothetical protein